MKRIILTLLLILWASSAWGANCGGATACSCGDTVTSDYTLSGNLTCTNAGVALTIGANDIDINLAGYTIDGDDANTTFGIDATDRSGLTITGPGTIKDFTFDGIRVQDGANPTVTSITTTSNGRHGMLFTRDDSAADLGTLTVSNNIAHTNGEDGISVRIQDFSNCKYTLVNIQNNIAHTNDDAGIQVVGNIDGGTISGNTVYSNGQDVASTDWGLMCNGWGDVFTGGGNWGAPDGNNECMTTLAAGKTTVVAVLIGDSCTEWKTSQGAGGPGSLNDCEWALDGLDLYVQNDGGGGDYDVDNDTVYVIYAWNELDYITNNTSYSDAGGNSDGVGIGSDRGLKGTIVNRNNSYLNTGVNYKFAGTDTIFLQNNISRSSSYAGIFMQRSTGYRVDNNTCVYDNTGDNNNQGSIMLSNFGTVTSVRNNALFGFDGYAVRSNAPAVQTGEDTNIDYNLSYSDDAGKQGDWSNVGSTNSLTSDPLLVHPGGTSARHHELMAGSPCCGAGTDLSGTFTTDFNGSTRSRWDIGAFTCPSYFEYYRRMFGFF